MTKLPQEQQNDKKTKKRRKKKRNIGEEAEWSKNGARK
jgi:hypothetical protein